MSSLRFLQRFASWHSFIPSSFHSYSTYLNQYTRYLSTSTTLIKSFSTLSSQQSDNDVNNSQSNSTAQVNPSPPQSYPSPSLTLQHTVPDDISNTLVTFPSPINSVPLSIILNNSTLIYDPISKQVSEGRRRRHQKCRISTLAYHHSHIANSHPLLFSPLPPALSFPFPLPLSPLPFHLFPHNLLPSHLPPHDPPHFPRPIQLRDVHVPPHRNTPRFPRVHCSFGVHRRQTQGRGEEEMRDASDGNNIVYTYITNHPSRARFACALPRVG